MVLVKMPLVLLEPVRWTSDGTRHTILKRIDNEYVDVIRIKASATRALATQATLEAAFQTKLIGLASLLGFPIWEIQNSIAAVPRIVWLTTNAEYGSSETESEEPSTSSDSES